MGFLSELLTKYNLVKTSGYVVPRRTSLNFLGGTVVDDPANDQTNITVGGSTSSGATITLAPFTQPNVGSTVSVVVQTTQGLQAGQSIAIGGGGYYINQSTVDATHLLLLNTGSAVNQAPLGTVAADELVTIAGQGAPLAAQARLNGQALQLLVGQDTPGGILPAVNVLSSGAIDDTFVTQNALLVQNDLDANAQDTLLVQPTDTGFYGLQQPLMLTGATANTGIRKIQGKNGRGGFNPGVSGLCVFRTGGAHNVPSFIGPLIAITSIADPAFRTRTQGSGSSSGPINTALFRNDQGLGQVQLKLHETGQGTILGLTKITVRMFLYIPSASVSPGGIYTIQESYGNLYSGGPAARAIRLTFDTTSGNHIGWGLTTASGAANGIGTAAVPLDQLFHLAITYDSTAGTPTVRTFINGVADVTYTGLTGAVVQQWYEDHNIAHTSLLYPLTDTSGNGGVNNMEYGSLQITNTCEYTTNFSPPTTEHAMVGTASTLMLMNFGAANRSSTRTATANNPSGHQGFIVSLCNAMPIQTGLDNGAGVPVWNPWHGGAGGPGRNNLEIADLCFETSNDAIYINAVQGTLIERCTFNGCTRSITTCDLGYFTTIRDCGFSGGNDDLVGYSWAVGVFSEMTTIEHCTGSAGLWAVVVGGYGATLECRHCYFDAGSLGLLMAQGAYSLMFENCSFFQEFSNMSIGILYLANILTFRYIGGSITPMGFAGPAITLARTSNNTGGPQNTTASCYFDCHFGAYSAAEPFFFFAGDWYMPVEVHGYSPDIQGFADPGTAPTSWMGTTGVGPLFFPQLQAGTWTTAMPDSNLSYPVNNFFAGTWLFTGALTADRTVTIPYNIAGAEKRIHNGTTGGHSLLFVGPDGGTPVTVTNGKTADIYCTATWQGAGTMHGTWLRGTVDA